MDTIISVIGPVFWGALVLSILVFLHEGGHFLAARACGVRVTEFFLGMPCRFNLHHRSRRIGTKFGVTPLLIGGYAAICGMEPDDNPLMPSVLSLVHAKGTATVGELAEELGKDADEVLDACALLCSWGSIEPVYDAAKGERPGYYPSTYAAQPRDEAGNTLLDGRRFDRKRATAQGEAWVPRMGERAFFEAERSRTYVGKGFWARALMLVAGIAVNIATGFLIMVFAYSVLGTQVAYDTNELGGVTAGSPAAEMGLQAGDVITSIDGVETESWSGIMAALDGVQPGDEVALTCRRTDSADVEENLTLTLDEEGMLGIEVLQETIRLAPLDAVRMTGALIVQTAEGVGRLLMPQHTMEILDNSSSIVGISVMSSQAASQGAAPLLRLMALVSFSLAFMNLLPIPPLDGGKLLIEVVQGVTRRQVPMRVQTVLSYVGVGLFLLLFVYMLRLDVLRIIGG